MEQSLYDNIYQVEETHWWYMARRDIIFDWVKRMLSNYKTPRVLDIGCGTGFNIRHLRQIGYQQVDGLDISLDALAYCKSRQLNSLLFASAENLPIQPFAYDVILGLDIVEHIENDRQVLSEMFRALKPDGALIVFVPAYQFLWSFQDEISHHQRRYQANDLKQKVTQAGFEVKKISYVNSFLFPVIWLGRNILRAFPNFFKISSESQMNPTCMNQFLYYIFKAEMPLLHWMNFPFGVSILCICTKPNSHRTQTGS
jgi:SAM-dependent methyltransferase